MAGTVHDVENKALLTQVRQEAADAAQQLMEASHLRKGQIVVVGCRNLRSGTSLVWLSRRPAQRCSRRPTADRERPQRFAHSE